MQIAIKKMNPEVDLYLKDGCMRCKFGATENCKVHNWKEELKLLRQIVLETKLTEEIKWGVPVYTHHSKNIVTINALKESANIGFFKGVLLKDEHKILQQQGNIQSARIIKFTNLQEIKAVKKILQTYILEAIKIEEVGQKVELKKNVETIPEELVQEFQSDSKFKNSFYALTPSKQRGYIIYFSQPKQAKTRMDRIEKCKHQICNGVGLNDKYSC